MSTPVRTEARLLKKSEDELLIEVDHDITASFSRSVMAAAWKIARHTPGLTGRWKRHILSTTQVSDRGCYSLIHIQKVRE